MLLNDAECGINICALCRDYNKHINNAGISRSEYRKDCEESIPDDVIKVAVDMQKVIMLPSIPGEKTAIFTKTHYSLPHDICSLRWWKTKETIWPCMA